ncbi:MAG: SMI1/KNR4 family protein [Alphaproteobacteria bacterium]|nr:SMI1/KNR4 family protein [Alphaproteobacteria bacterium]
MEKALAGTALVDGLRPGRRDAGDLWAAWRRHDGEAPGPDAGILRGSRMLALHELEDAMQHRLDGDWPWRPGWQPISEDESGSCFYVRTSGVDVGAVFHWTHDGDTHTPVAPDVDGLLATIASDLAAGRWVLDDGHLVPNDARRVGSGEGWVDDLVEVLTRGLVARRVYVDETVVGRVLDVLVARLRVSGGPARAWGDLVFVDGEIRVQGLLGSTFPESAFDGGLPDTSWLDGLEEAAGTRPRTTLRIVAGAATELARRTAHGRKVVLPGLGTLRPLGKTLMLDPPS